MQQDLGFFQQGWQPRQGFGSDYFSPPKAQNKTPKQTKKKGNFLTSLLPSVGGIGGSAAGAAIGTALLPVPGAGTIAGALIGGALGGGGGKLTENAVEGNKLSSGVAGEAALNGVLSAGPIRLAKLTANTVRGTRALGFTDALRSAGEGAAGVAAKSAVSSAEPLRTSTAGKLKEYGNAALASQYGTISKPVARATNPSKTIDALANMGITNPKDAERIASVVTGSNGILNKAVIKATGNAGKVDTSGLRQVFTDALDNTGVVGKDRKSLETFFNAQLSRATGGPRGQIGKGSNPSDILDVMKAFEKRSANLKGRGANYRLSTPERMDQAKVLDLVQNDLEDRLYKGAGANSNLQSVLTPELRTKLIDLFPNNKAWAEHVDKNILSAKDIGAIRSAQRPFVNVKKIIDEGDINQFTFGGRVANGPNGLLGRALEIGENVVKKPAARIAGKTLRKASGVSNTVTQKDPYTLGNVAKRVAPVGIAQALMNGAQNTAEGSPLPQPDMPVQDNTNNSVAPLLGQQSSNSDPYAGANSPFNPDNVQENIAKLVASGGSIEDVTKYIGIVQALSDLRSPQSDNGLNSTTATQVAASANAVNTLDQLEGLFKDAGNGSGRLRGTAQNAFSRVGLNNNTQTYNDLSASSVSQLARALNGGGQVSDADAAVVVQALPKITDNPTVAANKFKALRKRLEAARQNTLFYNGRAAPSGQGQQDLASALGY